MKPKPLNESHLFTFASIHLLSLHVCLSVGCRLSSAERESIKQLRNILLIHRQNECLCMPIISMIIIAICDIDAIVINRMGSTKNSTHCPTVEMKL